MYDTVYINMQEFIQPRKMLLKGVTDVLKSLCHKIRQYALVHSNLCKHAYSST
jgi:hypothetical protein